MTRVRVPTPLRSYTDGEGLVQATGATVRELLDDVERSHPGMRFRMIDEQECIRRHIRLFINDQLVSDLAHPVTAKDEFTIICSISGG